MMGAGRFRHYDGTDNLGLVGVALLFELEVLEADARVA